MGLDSKDYEQLLKGYKDTNKQLEDKIACDKHTINKLMNQNTELSKLVSKVELQGIIERMSDEISTLQDIVDDLD